LRLDNFINELSSDFGAGLTLIDVDETIFQTKAMIYVMYNGQIINKLSNQDFNTYKLKDGESFDFREFGDAELFSKTSIPIPKTVERIKRMFKHIDVRGSKVVILTARKDFDDKDVFLATFSKIGIPIHNIYVERTGNMSTGTVASRKKQVIMKYLNTGNYRRVRLIDDDIHNLTTFLSIKDNLPQELINRVKSKHNIKDGETIAPIEFYALQVIDSSGTLKLIQNPRMSEKYKGIINIITVLDIIQNCHKVHINEGFMDSVSSMVNKIKGMVTGSDLVKNFEIEKGLLSYMKDTGIGGSQMLYHAFNAYFNKNEDSKLKIKELSQSVKKEHLIDILMKLDVLTLHFITGPLHMIEAVTGWNILSGIKAKIEPVEKQAKQAVHSLETLSKGLDDKLRSQLQNYANAIRRVFGIGDFKKISETTAIGSIGYLPGEVLGAVGSFGGPDNLIGADPEWMHPPAKKKQSLENFLVISNQQDWDDLFSSFWNNGENTEQVSKDPELDGNGEPRSIKEDVVASASPVGTTTADIAVPDTLIGGQPGDAPSMTRRLKKKKKKRKSFDNFINQNNT
jgi:hypothetical protein